MRAVLVRVATVALFLSALSASAAISQSERDALIALYNSTNGPEWIDNTGWLGAAGTECSWYGVYCDEEETSVGVIYLGDNNLSGAIPSGITGLDNLWSLGIPNNNLSGGFPMVLTQMDWLGDLDIEGNKFTGQIPAAIANMEGLEYLRLDYNDFEGPLPQEMKSLSLLGLSFSATKISGTLSDHISFVLAFPDLEVLGLSALGLTGTIPPTISQLTKLTSLNLSENGLEGDIAAVLMMLAPMTSLEDLLLDQNRFTGQLPQDFSSFSNMTGFSLWGNEITGPIPAGIGTMTKLYYLDLDSNLLTGTIPTELGNLVEMQYLWLSANRLEGPIPTSFANLTKLQDLVLYDNRLTGPFPGFLSAAPELSWLSLWGNQLSGPIPTSMADFKALRWVDLDGNQFDGTIPREIGQMTELLELWLGSNLLEGSIPSEIGNLTKLETLVLDRNNLRGEVPATIMNLTTANWISMEDNALRASNGALEAFLREKGGLDDYPFEGIQTIPPTDIEVESVTAVTATLIWTPILYDWEAGGYQVLASTTPGGPYTPVVTTATKWDEGVVVTGLQPSTTYYFVLQTVTYPHGENPYFQLNTVFSDQSVQVSATTLGASSASPEVILTAYTQGIFQSPGVGGGTDTYTLTNVGGAPTSITLTQDGTFFTQAPMTFELQPGASQVVTLTGVASPEGEYEGESYPTGAGVDPEESVYIYMLSSPIESHDFNVIADQNRIDLIAPEGQNPTGTLTFRNSGTGTFTGVASSDVQFIKPQTGLITIAPGASATVTVTSDRAKRPDADLLIGTQVGRVNLVAIGGIAKGRAPSQNPTSASLVTVVDTVKPPTGDGAAPPLGEKEVALFMTSVGHIVGSVGQFVSDVSILNSYGTGPVNDLKLYYTPSTAGAQTKVATMKALGSSQAVGLADIVKSVFGGEAEVGTLQIRSRQTTNMSASANIFNSSNPAGNYGTSIPVFRSDRSAKAGDELFITGLRKDEQGHTNLYIQETRGAEVTAKLDYFTGSGVANGTATETLTPWQMKSLINPLADGTAAVRVTAVSGDGAVAAFATPVDRASGDTWAVTDWAKQFGYSTSEPAIIPVGGAAKGANNTDFRTDVAITNRCASVVVPDKGSKGGAANRSNCRDAVGKGTLRYYPTSGGMMEKDIELGLLQTASMNDVVRSVFGIDTTTVGHMVFLPVSGEFALTSRTYTIVAGSPATFGSTVPAIGQSMAIRPGQSRRIGALSDTTLATVGAATPATSRTNFGIVETQGEPVSVRVSVFYNDPRSLAAGKPIGSVQYDLAPNQLLTKSGLVEAIIGPSRQSLYGDLSGVQVQFDVISSTGAIIVYTSSVDNGTGDSILRTE